MTGRTNRPPRWIVRAVTVALLAPAFALFVEPAWGLKRKTRRRRARGSSSLATRVRPEMGIPPAWMAAVRTRPVPVPWPAATPAPSPSASTAPGLSPPPITAARIRYRADREKLAGRLVVRWLVGGFDVMEVTRAQPAPAVTAAAGAACLKELTRLGVPYRPVPPVLGISTPIVVTGDIGGIKYTPVWSARPRLMDCRLAVALYRAAPVIRAAGFDTVHYWGFYTYRNVAGTRRLSRHARGMAVDVFKLSGAGQVSAEVGKQWEKFSGRPGACIGSPKAVESARLRAMICRMESLKLFRRILTPDTDWGHRDHFHFSGAFARERWNRRTYGGHIPGRALPTAPKVRRRRRRRGTGWRWKTVRGRRYKVWIRKGKRKRRAVRRRRAATRRRGAVRRRRAAKRRRRVGIRRRSRRRARKR